MNKAMMTLGMAAALMPEVNGNDLLRRRDHSAPSMLTPKQYTIRKQKNRIARKARRRNRQPRTR